MFHSLLSITALCSGLSEFHELEAFEPNGFVRKEIRFELRKERVSFEIAFHERYPQLVGESAIQEFRVRLGSSDYESGFGSVGFEHRICRLRRNARVGSRKPTAAS